MKLKYHGDSGSKQRDVKMNLAVKFTQMKGGRRGDKEEELDE